MNAKEKELRIGYIDIFRGIGILLMIMGHVGFGGRFYHFIHAFHMPMFFWVSGFLFGNKPSENIELVGFIKKKSQTLLVPYCFFGFFHWVMLCIFHWSDIQNNGMTEFIEPLVHLLFVNTEGLAITGALWFLTALFLTEVIYLLLIRYVGSNVWRNILVVILALSGNIATRVLPYRLPYALDAALVGIGLFHIGYLMQKYKMSKLVSKLLNMKKICIFLFAVVIAVSIFRSGYVNMRTGEYADILFFWVNSIGATLVIVNCSHYLVDAKERCRIIDVFINFIEMIGKNSIVYVCLNEFIIMILTENIHFGEETHWFIRAVIILGLTLGVLRICDRIINETKLRVIIGKRKNHEENYCNRQTIQ